MRRGRAWFAAIALGVLSACSSPDTADRDEAKVASLTSPGPATSASATSTRPRYRLDMTAEDEKALWVPYNKCLQEHGFTRQDAKIQADAQTKGEPVNDKTAEQLRDCEQKHLPLVEWEKDPANPKAADFQRDVNDCLRAKGITLKNATIDEETDVARAMELTAVCEREVAARPAP